LVSFWVNFVQRLVIGTVIASSLGSGKADVNESCGSLLVVDSEIDDNVLDSASVVVEIQVEITVSGITDLS
jgi:hypothetical protein